MYVGKARSMKNVIKNSWIYNKLPKSTQEKIKTTYHKAKDDGYATIREDYYTDKVADPAKLRISFVIPQPIIGSGGHRNIYRIVRYLSNKGYGVTCYIDPEGLCSPSHCRTGMEAYEKITENFFDLGCDIIFGCDDIKECDVLFATHAASAYIVKRNESQYKLGCYFIQDYESFFFPMGDDFISAHNTYKLGLYPITSGPWPLEMLKKNFGIKEGNSFRFPINTNVYYLNDKIKRKDNKIIFFAKPGMPRRCYRLGVDALNLVKQEIPDAEIVFYGEDSSHYKNVPFKFTNLGLVNTIEQLGDLYRSASIGIAFSTTNPSLVPYEMMSCGCAVVDLDFNGSVVSYENYNNITLVDTTPEKVAEGIIKLYKDSKLREKQVKNALELCKKFPNEETMCSLVEEYILRAYNNKVGGK